MSLGIAELWRAAGVAPDVVVGHSQGEVTAATIAGHLSYEDGARIIALRSRLAKRTAGRGRMLAVDLGVDQAEKALEGFEDSVSLAVNNGPSSCVLSGDTDAVLDAAWSCWRRTARSAAWSTSTTPRTATTWTS